jgi:hypothetical protein
MAGIGHLKEFSAESLRGLVDESVAQRLPKLADKYLPTAQIYSRTFAYDIIKKNQHIAAMIAYGAEAPVVDRDAVAKMHGEIAKMGVKYIVTEEELLAIHEARNNDEKSAMVERLILKGAELVEMVQARIDLMKLQAITLGAFNYDANGVKIDVDFGIPAEHKIVLADGADWDVTTRDALQDVLDAVATYRATNGQDPEDILMSPEAFAKLQRNSVIILEAGRPSGATRASAQDVRDVFQSYGLPNITIVTERSISVKNFETGAIETIEYLPQNRVVMVSSGVGEYLQGITVEGGFRPVIALTAHDKDEPIMSIMKAVAAGFPAVERPELILHMDVF